MARRSTIARKRGRPSKPIRGKDLKGLPACSHWIIFQFKPFLRPGAPDASGRRIAQGRLAGQPYKFRLEPMSETEAWFECVKRSHAIKADRIRIGGSLTYEKALDMFLVASKASPEYQKRHFLAASRLPRGTLLGDVNWHLVEGRIETLGLSPHAAKDFRNRIGRVVRFSGKKALCWGNELRPPPIRNG